MDPFTMDEVRRLLALVEKDNAAREARDDPRGEVLERKLLELVDAISAMDRVR